MRALALVIVLAACRADGDDDYTIIPGGDDTIIGPQPDAARPDGVPGDGGATIDGRVCLVFDPRNLTTCAATGAGGLAVTLGTQSALTGDDGSFTIATPEGTNLVWHVTGAPIIPSVMPLSSSTLVPAIDRVVYEDLLSTNNALLLADQGSIFARIVRQGFPLAGAIVEASPPPENATFYDGTSATLWERDATGASGVAWIAGADVGTSTLTVTPPVGSAVSALVPVEQLATTFVTIAVP